MIGEWLALLAVASGAQVQPQMTKEKAIKRAQEFCSKIGVDASGAPTAVYPAPRGLPSLPDYFLAPRWKVTFANGAEVEVVDGTSVVSRFQNHALTRSFSDDRRPFVSAITDDEAVRRAREVLAATGQSEELEEPKARLGSTFTRPQGEQVLATDMKWSIGFQRQYQGIRYRDDGAGVTLNADDGQVRSVTLRFSMPSPRVASMKALFKVDSVRARAVAAAHLARFGLSEVETMAPLKLELVNPNSFWSDGRSVNREPGPVRPAWTCVIRTGERSAYGVWVDAETAEIIGGENWGSLGPPALRFPNARVKSKPTSTNKRAPKKPQARREPKWVAGGV